MCQTDKEKRIESFALTRLKNRNHSAKIRCLIPGQSFIFEHEKQHCSNGKTHEMSSIGLSTKCNKK